MNKRQKEVLRQQLKNEKEVLKQIEADYKVALDRINERIMMLQAAEETQSKIYQIQYQEALRGQITEVLRQLHQSNYSTIQGYLQSCYVESFAGTLYDLQGQGIPLIFPIDQRKVIRAVELRSKLDGGLYRRLGLNISALRETIAEEMSRGFATSSSYETIARNVSRRTGSDYHKTKVIVATEGHRIQSESTLDAINAAVECGAKVMKTWDATLDNLTRPTHRELDGTTIPYDENFVSPSGATAQAPGEFGVPEEDINCRCALLQRAAEWMDEDADMTKLDNLSGELIHIKEKDYKAFKTAYFERVGFKNK